MAEFIIEIPFIDRFKDLLKQAPEVTMREMRAAADRSLTRLQKRERQEMPRRSGKMASSVQKRIEGMGGRVGPRIFYAPYVHDGTKPHTILPRNKKALWWPGAAHPVRRVQHPGTKPNPFVERTLKGEKVAVKNEYVKAGERILQSIKV